MYFNNQFFRDSIVLEEGAVYDNKNWDKHRGIFSTDKHSEYGAGSFICDCKQKLPKCVPKDRWQVKPLSSPIFFFMFFFYVQTVVICDNTQNTEDTDCSYSYKIGSTYTTKLMTSLSISASFSAEVGVTFKAIFAGKSSTLTTGFQFTAEYDFQQSVTQTLSVSTKVSKGEMLSLIYKKKIIFFFSQEHILKSTRQQENAEAVPSRQTCLKFRIVIVQTKLTYIRNKCLEFFIKSFLCLSIVVKILRDSNFISKFKESYKCYWVCLLL